MKKFVWMIAIFCWMVYGVYCLLDHLNGQPSEQAQKIIDSLNSGKGWKYYEREFDGRYVSNISSEVTIYPCLFAIVKHKGQSRTNYFSWKDLYQINNATVALMAIHEGEKKVKVKEAVNDNLKSLNDAINKME